MKKLQQALSYAGAGGTLVCLMILLARPSGQSASDSLLRLLLFLPLVSIWSLSPYWALFREQRQARLSRTDAVVLLAATALIVALGASVYLPTFVFFAPPRRVTGSAMALLFVPVCQWVLLSAAWGVQALLRYSRR